MDHQDGNITGLYVAEETTPGVLPVTPIWYEREPNSYADFGGNYAMTTRKPITHDRQNSKGEISDNNPTSGWNEDLTPSNMPRLLQGFLLADAREKPSTAPLNGTQIDLTGADDALDQFTAASGLGIFLVGHLVLGAGFTNADNNGVNRVTAKTATALTMASPVTEEASPPADARLTAVGFQFGSGVASLVVTDENVFLDTGAIDATTFDLTPGEYIFVGGDDAAMQFAASGNNAPFYGRVSAVTADGITLDKTTGVQATNAGTGKTIQIYFGTVIRNEEDCALIKPRTYTQERQYGCGATVSAEYVVKAAPNQLTITVPSPGADAKVTVDLGFIAGTSYERTVAEGLLSGTRVPALNEPCFKPGLDVYQHKLAVVDPTTLNPTALVSYNSELSLVINNNASGLKAIETFGNFSTSYGAFNVSGSVNAYWTSVEATRAVRLGKDLTWHLILTKARQAVIYDMESVGVGGGRANVSANEPVRMPLETAAGKGAMGYTLCTTFLHHVPNAGMAQQTT
jgi:hypothetical protein